MSEGSPHAGSQNNGSADGCSLPSLLSFEDTHEVTIVSNVLIAASGMLFLPSGWQSEPNFLEIVEVRVNLKVNDGANEGRKWLGRRVTSSRTLKHKKHRHHVGCNLCGR